MLFNVFALAALAESVISVPVETLWNPPVGISVDSILPTVSGALSHGVNADSIPRAISDALSHGVNTDSIPPAIADALSHGVDADSIPPALSNAFLHNGFVDDGFVSHRPHAVTGANDDHKDVTLFSRHLSLSEGGCFHGRTARTLDEEAPWAGGSVGCTYYPAGPHPEVEEYKLIPGVEGAAIQNVSITAAFESMDPLQIKMTVNNTTPLPITFWKEWSPISKHGWELGYFSIESEIWGQFFGRVGEKYRMATLTREDIPKRPENIDELVQLNPGESLSEIVTIPYCEPKEGLNTCKPFMWERWTEMLRLAGIKRIFIQGDWYGVWAQPKEEVMANMVDNPMDGYWTRWWAKNILFPTKEQDKEFGTYLPFDEPWYTTEAALTGVLPANITNVN